MTANMADNLHVWYYDGNMAAIFRMPYAGNVI
jgi:hypothetical protein